MALKVDKKIGIHTISANIQPWFQERALKWFQIIVSMTFSKSKLELISS